MANKLINLAEFNRAVKKSLAGTEGIDFVLDALAPKSIALFVDVHAKATGVGPLPRDSFAHACNFKIHSATTQDPKRRKMFEDILASLPDHADKIKTGDVKPFGRKGQYLSS